MGEHTWLEFTIKIQFSLANIYEFIKHLNVELYKAGDYYGEEDLMEECQNDLKSYISVDNSCQFYAFAVAVDALVRLRGGQCKL